VDIIAVFKVGSKFGISKLTFFYDDKQKHCCKLDIVSEQFTEELSKKILGSGRRDQMDDELIEKPNFSFEAESKEIVLRGNMASFVAFMKRHDFINEAHLQQLCDPEETDLQVFLGKSQTDNYDPLLLRAKPQQSGTMLREKPAKRAVCELETDQTKIFKTFRI